MFTTSLKNYLVVELNSVLFVLRYNKKYVQYCDRDLCSSVSEVICGAATQP